MIKQDTEAAMLRAVEHAHIREERKAREKNAACGGWRLLAVQSIACVVILLLALFVRLGGGTMYEQLRGLFGDSLLRNDLAAAVVAIWDGDPNAAVSSDPLVPEEDTADSTTTTTAATTTTATTQAAAGVSDTGGRLPPDGAVAVALRVTHPVHPPLEKGRLTAVYGYRSNPTGAGEQFHRGVDIAAPSGTPLKAMFYATVSAVGESASLGKYVKLTSGKTVIVYGHCHTVAVTKGTAVRAGETVAYVGATGDVTGSHVHIAVSVDGIAYNPAGLVPLERYA